MKFTDYILIDTITPKIKATDKQGVIHEMVQSLVDAGGIKQEDCEVIVKTVIKREELGTTGIGHGVAFPHTRHPSMKRHIGTVAISTEGIDFDSFDGEKVKLFFLVISPTPDDPGGHVSIMAHLSQRLQDETLCRFLQQAQTREDIFALLEEDDRNENR